MFQPFSLSSFFISSLSSALPNSCQLFSTPLISPQSFSTFLTSSKLSSTLVNSTQILSALRNSSRLFSTIFTSSQLFSPLFNSFYLFSILLNSCHLFSTFSPLINSSELHDFNYCLRQQKLQLQNRITAPKQKSTILFFPKKLQKKNDQRQKWEKGRKVTRMSSSQPWLHPFHYDLRGSLAKDHRTTRAEAAPRKPWCSCSSPQSSSALSK